MSAKLLLPLMRIFSPTNSSERFSLSCNTSASREETSSITSSWSSGSSSTPSSGFSLLKNKDKYKVVVMGAGGVGKTALISRFLYNKYPESYKPTIEDMHAVDFPLASSVSGGDSDEFTLEMIDTSGTMRFPAMQVRFNFLWSNLRKISEKIVDFSIFRKN